MNGHGCVPVQFSVHKQVERKHFQDNRVRTSKNMLLHKSNDNAGKNGQNQLFHDWKLKLLKTWGVFVCFCFFLKIYGQGTSPVVQWLRVCLPTEAMWVRSFLRSCKIPRASGQLTRTLQLEKATLPNKDPVQPKRKLRIYGWIAIRIASCVKF